MCLVVVWMLGPNWPRGGEIDIIEGKPKSRNKERKEIPADLIRRKLQRPKPPLPTHILQLHDSRDLPTRHAAELELRRFRKPEFWLWGIVSFPSFLWYGV